MGQGMTSDQVLPMPRVLAFPTGSCSRRGAEQLTCGATEKLLMSHPLECRDVKCCHAQLKRPSLPCIFAHGSLDILPAAASLQICGCMCQEGQGGIRALIGRCAPVQHNFQVSGICVAPVHLHLRNCLPHSASLSIEVGHLQPHVAPSRTPWPPKLCCLCMCTVDFPSDKRSHMAARLDGLQHSMAHLAVCTLPWHASIFPHQRLWRAMRSLHSAIRRHLGAPSMRHHGLCKQQLQAVRPC